jgi:hypothetical protein
MACRGTALLYFIAMAWKKFVLDLNAKVKVVEASEKIS